MAYVTLYSFYKPPVGIGPGTLYTVIRDDTDLYFIDFYTTSTLGGPTQPPEGTVISVVCQGTTKYTYKVKTNPSYATVTSEANSIYCGYTPPTCDIFEKSFTKTDETNTGANDGTANMFAVSSFAPITYYLLHPLEIASNTIGLFTGLAPGDYSIKAVDSNNCSIIHSFTINAFDPSLTRCKYRVQFTDVLQGVTWRLDFLDQKHTYDPDLYPIYLTGTDSPIIYGKANQNEDKTEPIISKQLQINVIQDGTFEVDEFAQANERTWFMKLYRDDDLEYQGWLLPDQTQDYYADPNYAIQLLTTDGLPSLKGSNFGDQSIFTYDSNMNKLYTQRYGLFTWCYLVKICLDWLDYDYGETIVVSSLRNNDAFDQQFFANISTWGDNYYDSSGNPVDVYSALSDLLRSLKLCIIQHKGSFILVNWNDLWYIDAPLQASDYNLSFFKFNDAMDYIILAGNGVTKPELLQIGATKILKPINPMQSINYDLSYGIMKANVSFNILALLYENPSFEIGAVQGDLPYGFEIIGSTLQAYYNYEPSTNSPNLSAYDGDWVFRLQWVYSHTLEWVDFSPPFFIDQSNKLLNISFYWRGVNTVSGTNITPAIALIFTAQSSGNVYIFIQSPPSGSPSWVLLSSVSNPFTNVGVQISDFTAWNPYTANTTVFPEDGIGDLNIRIYAPDYYRPNNSYPDPVGTDTIMDIDELQLTLSDANDVYNLQIGETHTVTNVTNFSKSETKELALSLFTYPPNKRLAGQLMYGTLYSTATTFTQLKFQLQTTAPKGRLPAAIIGSWARTYQRPMHIFEGDIKAVDIDFYAVFAIDGYDGALFQPFSISTDLRNAVCHVVLVEFDDSDAQNVYVYKAKYEKNARQNR